MLIKNSYLDISQAERSAHVLARLLRGEEDGTDPEERHVQFIHPHARANLVERRPLFLLAVACGGSFLNVQSAA